MRRRVIDVTDLLRKGRPRGVKMLSASPAEQAIARQMAERDRRGEPDDADDRDGQRREDRH
jgi:hypothetical protein